MAAPLTPWAPPTAAPPAAAPPADEAIAIPPAATPATATETPKLIHKYQPPMQLPGLAQTGKNDFLYSIGNFLHTSKHQIIFPHQEQHSLLHYSSQRNFS